VVRRRLIAALVCVLLPAAADAQIAKTGFTGFATAFIGPSVGGDIDDAGWTPGAAIAIVDPSGLGVEIDVSHVRTFNAPRFLESGITTLTVNVTGVWADETAFVRPYVTGGGGLLRARACVSDCRLPVSRTDVGVDVGGGVFVLVNELFGVRGDVRYFRFLQRHADLPLTNNGFFDFWRLSVGATFSWPIR
jgi:hypothetical protein